VERGCDIFDDEGDEKEVERIKRPPEKGSDERTSPEGTHASTVPLCEAEVPRGKR